MKQIIVFSLLMLLLSSSVVFAQNDSIPIPEAYTDIVKDPAFDCEAEVADAEYAGFEVPEGVPFQNDIVQLGVREDGTVVTAHIEEGKLVELECEPSEEATIIIELDNYEQIEEIAQAENPLDAFLEAKASGAITMEGTSFITKVKLFFVNMGLRVASWFI